MLTDYVKHCCSLIYKLDVFSWLYGRIRAAVHWLWPGVRRIVIENTTAFITQYS